ncbi:MAG: family 20 glycosylhydrolase, partial [Acidobacteriota bacterium]
PYIHIGGDEAPKDAWKASQFVQDLKAKEGLKDEGEVQSYFVRRMEKFINSKGKKIIGWDEILEGGLAPNATVMSWRGIKGGIAAAKEHHDVIMTPTDYAYLDYGQGDPATEPLNIGGYLPLEKVYSFDPVPKELTPDEAKYIIGGQGSIWTEYLPTPASVEYMAFPRMLAIAEDVWSTPENKNFADFSKRLSANFAHLDKQNVNYRIPEPTGLENRVLAQTEAVSLDITPSIPGAKLYYTIDGSIPTDKSQLYTKPTGILEEPARDRMDVKVIEILPSGRTSSVYTATFLRRPWQGPDPEIKEKRSGVTYAFVTPPASGPGSPTIVSGETKTLALQQFAKTADLKQTFGVTFDGYFNAPVDGIYEFQVESTWDAGIFVGGVKLIDDVGTADRKTRSDVVALRAGLHQVSLRHNNRGGDPYYRVRWAIKGQNWRNIGGGELVH